MSSDTAIIDRRLSPETIIAAALMTPGVDGRLKLSQIAKMIHRLKNRGINISRMTCYLTGGSAHCDDLDRFVSKLHSFGFATDLSPVTLSSDGRIQCEKILSDAALEENAEELAVLGDRLIESFNELGYRP